jgi:hypothetical protein
MSFWEVPDIDKFLAVVLSDVMSAISGWLNGRPLDEVVLMNRLTEVLGRRRRGCDVGLQTPIELKCRVFLLHRQGNKQTDRYGSDLAITVYTKDRSLIKTVLFQLKRSSDLSTVLDKQQIDDAMIDDRVADRAFVFAADDTRFCIRVKPIREINSFFHGNQKQQTFYTGDWHGLSKWVIEWMECSIGPNSDPSDPNSIENLLEKYVIEHVPFQPWERGPDYDLPGNYLPLKLGCRPR